MSRGLTLISDSEWDIVDGVGNSALRCLSEANTLNRRRGAHPPPMSFIWL
jgi:hypothetical protein